MKIGVSASFSKVALTNSPSKSTSPIMVDVGLKISTAALASTLVAMLVANATPTAAGWL